MKKILIVDVPESPNSEFSERDEYIRILSIDSIKVLFNKAPVKFTGAIEFKELTLPSEEEIRTEAADTFEHGIRRHDFEEGANWILKRLTE